MRFCIFYQTFYDGCRLMASLGIIYIIMNIFGIYLLHRFLKNKLSDKLSVWLFSICLSLGVSFLFLLAGFILFLN
jgi:uncharacterized membrane protein YqhA